MLACIISWYIEIQLLNSKKLTLQQFRKICSEQQFAYTETSIITVKLVIKFNVFVIVSVFNLCQDFYFVTACDFGSIILQKISSRSLAIQKLILVGPVRSFSTKMNFVIPIKVITLPVRFPIGVHVSYVWTLKPYIYFCVQQMILSS